MYAVVGCSECSNLWIVEGRSETSQCPRCGSRRKFAKRKRFVETEDADHAREVRASMLATRQGHGEAFAELDSVAELDAQVADGVVSDEEYLEASGLDVGELEAVDERAMSGPTRRGSKTDVVETALDDLDRPTEDEVVDYAAERGVGGEYVSRTLEKLVRRGAVSESGGRYRLL